MNSVPHDSAFDEDPEATARLPTLQPVVIPADAPEWEVSTDVVPAPLVQAHASESGERLRELELQLQHRDERVRQLEMQLAAAEQQRSELQAKFEIARQDVAPRYHAEDIEELRRRSERHLEALTSWQGFRAMSDALLADAETRNAQLEARIATFGESPRAPATAPQSETDALKAELVALKSDFDLLQSELLGAPHVKQQAGQQAGIEANANMAVELPRRVLVRQQGGAKVVYPIGRRTTIGRTANNDIQIDTSNVSRRHAVLLSSPDECIVEDLNSTNGVQVNGQRVARQVLRDGDVVIVGRVQFRFLQRS